MKKHVNIPIFIPHLGCPNQCVFCNQRTISGTQNFDIGTVDQAILNGLSTVLPEQEVEIAFFGGSFTGIDRSLMISLLEIAYKYIESGRVSSIRLSTRPDYIDEEILDILNHYGVKTIELGLQSINDKVLSISKRGHTSIDAEKACKMIVDAGFLLVGQMMVGLPGSTLESELETAEFIIKCGAKGARIYPTVVFRDTELCDMALSGDYTPITVDDAILRSSMLFQRFIDAGIGVIRIGLCSQDTIFLDDTYFAGPNHPALGELVIGEFFYQKIRKVISKLNKEKINNCLHIYVAPGMLSKAIGQKKKNKIRLLNEFGLSEITFRESNLLKEYEFKIDFERK